MLRLLRNFLKNESGTAGVEMAFVASILVLGSVIGLLAVRAELFETAQAVQDVR
jgi:Flp pilus assembly protein TadG